MIVFVMTRGHEYTVAPLANRSFGFKLPEVRTASYDRLFRARKVSAATYVFCDIERLAPSELQLAGELYSALGEAGLVRLNNPAVAMGRYELLRSLHDAGFNPFNAYRAEEQPRPKRFPVILRREFDHDRPVPRLVESQTDLDATLADFRARNVPLRGWLVVEFCAEPIAPEMWRQFGTFRIGDTMHVDHAVVENSWCAKLGTPGLATEDVILDTRRSIETNAFADAIRPAFEIAGIEYGRADHATVGGRQVVYEINTNPIVRGPRTTRSPIYTEALAFSRERFAGFLWKIDSGSGRQIPFPRSKRLKRYRRKNFWTRPPIRP